MTNAFSILRSPAWPSLLQRLHEAVAADASLAAAREALLRPLRLLEAIAVDAPAALGDDFLAAERVRATIYLAYPYAALIEQASKIGGSRSSLRFDPGVLDYGRFVVVVLAAL